MNVLINHKYMYQYFNKMKDKILESFNKTIYKILLNYATCDLFI